MIPQSQAVEDYVKAIYKLGGESGEAVATQKLADFVGVKPASATAMVQKLAKLGWAVYEKYQGVSLTPKGKALAVELIRRHRILEVFLLEKLGYSWDEVDEEAEILEHQVSDKFIDRLWHFLGKPTQDPHGSPIPTPQGQWLPNQHWQKLSDWPLNTPAKVVRVKGLLPEFLRYLDELALLPGTLVEVTHKDTKGTLNLHLANEKNVLLDPHLAQHIFVIPLEE